MKEENIEVGEKSPKRWNLTRLEKCLFLINVVIAITCIVLSVIAVISLKNGENQLTVVHSAHNFSSRCDPALSDRRLCPGR